MGDRHFRSKSPLRFNSQHISQPKLPKPPVSRTSSRASLTDLLCLPRYVPVSGPELPLPMLSSLSPAHVVNEFEPVHRPGPVMSETDSVTLRSAEEMRTV